MNLFSATSTVPKLSAPQPREGGSVEEGAESVESASGLSTINNRSVLVCRPASWYSGLADSETWQVPLPADLAPGRYSVFTGLYRARDQERIPASDAKGSAFATPACHWAPVGSAMKGVWR